MCLLSGSALPGNERLGGWLKWCAVEHTQAADCPALLPGPLRRGEVVENVPPPLPLNTPLLLVKPPVGLSTPEIFKALDLDRRSTADPRQLLARLAAEGATQELTVNDLEQPAFDR